MKRHLSIEQGVVGGLWAGGGAVCLHRAYKNRSKPTAIGTLSRQGKLLSWKVGSSALMAGCGVATAATVVSLSVAALADASKKWGAVQGYQLHCKEDALRNKQDLLGRKIQELDSMHKESLRIQKKGNLTESERAQLNQMNQMLDIGNKEAASIRREMHEMRSIPLSQTTILTHPLSSTVAGFGIGGSVGVLCGLPWGVYQQADKPLEKIPALHNFNVQKQIIQQAKRVGFKAGLLGSAVGLIASTSFLEGLKQRYIELEGSVAQSRNSEDCVYLKLNQSGSCRSIAVSHLHPESALVELLESPASKTLNDVVKDASFGFLQNAATGFVAGGVGMVLGKPIFNLPFERLDQNIDKWIDVRRAAESHLSSAPQAASAEAFCKELNEKGYSIGCKWTHKLADRIPIETLAIQYPSTDHFARVLDDHGYSIQSDWGKTFSRASKGAFRSGVRAGKIGALAFAAGSYLKRKLKISQSGSQNR
jgi:hypothetical protein